MATRDVIVNFITRLNDSGIKAATKQTQGLGAITKKMSGVAIAGYAAASAAAIYYGQKAIKSSIKAALDDEKSQKLLAQSLRMTAGATNATIASTETQIGAMARATGTADDALRPALARLARSTHDTTSAFDLLGIAQNISSSTGVDLSSVTNALGKAYQGNTAALGKLGLGIDSTLLKSGNLTEIMSGLRTQFAGFSDVEAKTMSGQLKLISVAAGEASETIGFALIDSMKRLVGDSGNLKEVTKTFDSIALVISDVVGGLTSLTLGLADVGKKAAQYLGKNSVFQTFYKYTGLKYVIDGSVAVLKHIKEIGAEERISAAIALSNNTMRISARNEEYKAAVSLQKAQEKFLKTQKALADAANKAKKAKEDAAKLEELNAAKAKLAGQFDLDAIQLAASLKRKINEDDKTAVKTLQALATDDLTAIQKATIDLDVMRAKAAAAEADRRKTLAESSNTYSAQELANIAKVQTALDALKTFDYLGLASIAGTAGTTITEAAAVAKAKKTSQAPVIVINQLPPEPTPPPTQLPTIAQTVAAQQSPFGNGFDIFNQGQTSIPIAAIERSLAGYGGASFGGMAAATPLQDTFQNPLNYLGIPGTTVNVTVQGSVLSDVDLADKITNIVNLQNRLGNSVVLTSLGR